MNDSFFEMPIGFSVLLGIDKKALDFFSTLNLETKLRIKDYINSGNTINESNFRTTNAIISLRKNNLDFLEKHT